MLRPLVMLPSLTHATTSLLANLLVSLPMVTLCTVVLVAARRPRLRIGAIATSGASNTPGRQTSPVRTGRRS